MTQWVSRFSARGTWRSSFLAIVAGVLLTTNQFPASAAEGPFRLVEKWPQASVAGFISWVSADSKGLTYLFRRCPVKCSNGSHPGPADPPASVLLFDPAGKYLREWDPKSGTKAKEAHGMHIDRNGFIWTTDVQLHVVKKYRPDGTLEMVLGTEGVAGETETTFNMPTNVMVVADGSIFVTDGYGNQRMVKLNAAGKFLKAWGRKGIAPGEFRLPHSVAQDRSGRIIVADRCGLGETKCTDGRIQIFDANGSFVAQWTSPSGALAPMAVATDAADRLYVDDTQNSKIWILEAKSLKLLETVEGVSGHGMTVSSTGDDLYVTGSAAGVRRYTRAGAR